MGDNDGNEPEPGDGGATFWYCRHCGASGHDDPVPVNCPECGKPN